MTETSSPPPDSRRLYWRIVLAALAPIVALAVLFLFRIPLGQPHLLYRYTPYFPERLRSAAIGLAIALLFLWLLRLAWKCDGARRVGRYMAAGFVWLMLVLWTLLAPPTPVDQALFNLQSPSHEGAFVLESLSIRSIRDYVSHDYYERLARDPEEMLGRRVLSNPPGTTALFILIHRYVKGSPDLRDFMVEQFNLAVLDDARQETLFAAALLFALFMTLCWGASLIFAWLLARQWLPTPGAWVVAIGSVFNPATVNFTPGKDPAQLTLLLALGWCWLAAYRTGRAWYAVFCGGLLALMLTIGLIGVWIFAILAAATLIHAIRERGDWRSWVTGCAFPAIGGGLAVIAIFYFAFDWNIPLMTMRIGMRYGDIQEGVIADPFWWTLIGMPLFLLFVGPLFWAQLIAVKTDGASKSNSLGKWVLVCTFLVLTYAYFFANNNETPRLWMPFIPLLVWAMALRRPLLQGDSPRHVRIAVLLIALQLGGTLAHWSMMDVRESEYRLSTGRMWE